MLPTCGNASPTQTGSPPSKTFSPALFSGCRCGSWPSSPASGTSLLSACAPSSGPRTTFMPCASRFCAVSSARPAAAASVAVNISRAVRSYLTPGVLERPALATGLCLARPPAVRPPVCLGPFPFIQPIVLCHRLVLEPMSQLRTI